MGSTNYGNQQLAFDFNEDATGKLFNKTQYQLTPSGIYSGFTLSKLSDTYISVSAGLCYIQDDTSQLGTRVETTASQTLPITSVTPYIILRFNWIDALHNYMDILVSDFASIQASDLIVGRAIYENSGTTMLSTFDYSRKSLFYTNKIKTQNSYLRVSSTEPISNQFSISSGVLNSSKGNLIISGGNYPVSGVSNTVNGRYDIIYIDENGVVQVQEGIDSVSPVAPRYGNKKVVAEIRRGALRTTVYGSEIFSVLASFDVPPITSDLFLLDSGNLFSSIDVENALQEIAGSNFVFKGLKTIQGNIFIEASSGVVAETLKGAAGQNIQVLKKSDGSVAQYIDTNGKLVNACGTNLTILDKYTVFTTDTVEDAINQIAGEDMTIKAQKTFDTSPILPVATLSTNPIIKSQFDTHASTAATASLGHVKSGTDITVDASGNVSVVDNSHNHISSNITDATPSNTGNTIVKRDAGGAFQGHLVGTADYASSAGSATSASSAGYATSAGSANYASSAGSASSATTAGYAGSAGTTANLTVYTPGQAYSSGYYLNIAITGHDTAQGGFWQAGTVANGSILVRVSV